LNKDSQMTSYRKFAAALAVLVGSIVWASGERKLDLTTYLKALNGSPSYLGTITSYDGGGYSNLYTRPPDGGTSDAGFAIPLGSVVMVQCKAGHYVRVCNTGSTCAAVTTDVELNVVKQPFYSLLKMTQSTVAILPVDPAAASNSCNLFKIE
jgi:hypothetical protein